MHQVLLKWMQKRIGLNQRYLETNLCIICNSPKKPITNRIVTIRLNQKIGFLKKFSCLSLSSFDKDIFDNF
ncbi:hypothetical protein oki286_07620 [Helicobacter pylori]